MENQIYAGSPLPANFYFLFRISSLGDTHLARTMGKIAAKSNSPFTSVESFDGIPQRSMCWVLCVGHLSKRLAWEGVCSAASAQGGVLSVGLVLCRLSNPVQRQVFGGLLWRGFVRSILISATMQNFRHTG